MKKKIAIPLVIIVCFAAMWMVFRTIGSNAINGEWTMTSVLDENGKVILCSKDECANWPDAAECLMSLEAGKGQLAVNEDENTWTGSYEYNKSNLAGTIYTIELTEDGTEYQGLAVASNQVIFGGGSNRVLTLTVQYGSRNYTLYFDGK